MATATSTAAAEGPPGESAEALFVRAQGCWLRTAWPMTPLPTRNERCKALLRALRLPSKHASVEQLILLDERAIAPVVAALQSAKAESPTAHTELGRVLSASTRAHRETVNAMLAFQRTFATNLEQSIARKEGWPADLLDDTPWSERGVLVAHALAAISAWRALRDVGTPEARALALLVAEERLALAPALPLRLRPYALSAVLDWYGLAQPPEPVAGTAQIESDRLLRVKLLGAMGRALPRGQDFDEQLWAKVLFGLVDTLRTAAAGMRAGRSGEHAKPRPATSSGRSADTPTSSACPTCRRSALGPNPTRASVTGSALYPGACAPSADTTGRCAPKS